MLLQKSTILKSRIRSLKSERYWTFFMQVQNSIIFWFEILFSYCNNVKFDLNDQTSQCYLACFPSHHWVTLKLQYALNFDFEQSLPELTAEWKD